MCGEGRVISALIGVKRLGKYAANLQSTLKRKTQPIKILR